MEVFPVPQKFLSSGLTTEDINHPHPAQDLFLGDLAKSLFLIYVVWHIIWPSFDLPREDSGRNSKALLKTNQDRATGMKLVFHTSFLSSVNLP